MRLIGIFSFFVASFVCAEWIQPPTVTDAGYPVPRPGYVPELPRDHGSHPDFAIEWWYWVGHLTAVESGERFGFQSTVFRLAGDPEVSSEVGDKDALGTENLFMSHAALSELDADRYHHLERVYREGWQAWSRTDCLELSVGPIHVSSDLETSAFKMTVLYANQSRLELTLKPVKPLQVFGERGLSRKGEDPSAVSWYWTYTRMQVSGLLYRGSEMVEVNGIAWMDHEISSSQLGSNLEGWDWTAIQLDDGSEVKAYRLRGPNAAADPWSAVYWIDTDGRQQHVYASGFEWETLSKWRSSVTENEYPNHVRISVKKPSSGESLIYELRPILQDQEFVGNDGDNAYWEGACEVFDANGVRIGVAYLELAGYGGGLNGKLN